MLDSRSLDTHLHLGEKESGLRECGRKGQKLKGIERAKE